MRYRLRPLLIVRRRQDTELPSPFVFRYKLRTLLIVLALGPLLIALAWCAWSDLREVITMFNSL
jgi:hypothetical protein